MVYNCAQSNSAALIEMSSAPFPNTSWTEDPVKLTNGRVRFDPLLCAPCIALQGKRMLAECQAGKSATGVARARHGAQAKRAALGQGAAGRDV